MGMQGIKWILVVERVIIHDGRERRTTPERRERKHGSNENMEGAVNDEWWNTRVMTSCYSLIRTEKYWTVKCKKLLLN